MERQYKYTLFRSIVTKNILLTTIRSLNRRGAENAEVCLSGVLIVPLSVLCASAVHYFLSQFYYKEKLRSYFLRTKSLLLQYIFFNCFCHTMFVIVSCYSLGDGFYPVGCISHSYTKSCIFNHRIVII